MNTSAIAQMTVPLSALNACSAAPVPRPPQPMRQIFNVSAPPTNAERAMDGAVAKVAARPAMKLRRFLPTV